MDKTLFEIQELENWFLKEYQLRLHAIERCKYLGISPPENKYALELEAYEKDKQYRKLRGLPPLEEIKNIINL